MTWDYKEAEAAVKAFHKQQKHIQYKDISTAPLNGTKVLLLSEDSKGVIEEDMGYYNDWSSIEWRVALAGGITGEWSTELGMGEPISWKGLAE